MLTKNQTHYYWRLWAAVCDTQGWQRSDNTRRYALHAQARCPQSMTRFTNRDFNRFIDASAPLRETVDIRDRDRENALHTIHISGLSTAYIQSICRDLYGTADYQSLATPQLENLRNLIHNRARKHCSGGVPAADCLPARVRVPAADCPF